MKSVCAALLLSLVLPAAHASDEGFDSSFEAEDTPWIELAAKLPPPPADDRLLEFTVSAVAPHHYYIDRDSISVGSDGVIRYTVVIRTAGGVNNAFFEGLRCETAESRQYAHLRSDGSWMRASRSAWQPVALSSALAWRKALYEDFLCPDGLPVASAERAISLLLQQAR